MKTIPRPPRRLPLLAALCLCAALTTSCNYKGPAVKVSVGWNGVDLGVTLYGQPKRDTPPDVIVETIPDAQLPLPTK